MTVDNPAPVRVKRLDSLTGLRWWAAFGVFAHHMINLAPLPVVSGLLRFGSDGVMFFFVLSGFVLTWSARPATSAQTFWWRRFARIYPAHFVALLLAIPVFYSFDPDPSQSWVKPVNIGILLLSVVLVQGWSNDPLILLSGNPAAWTLACEAFFYAMHPFINRGLRLLKYRGTLFLALGILLLSFVYTAISHLWPGVYGYLPLPITRINEFALGMCAAWALRLGWRPRIPLTLIYVVGALFLVWVWYSPTHFVNGGPVGEFIRATENEWLMILCVLLIVAVGTRDLVGGRSLLRSRPLVRLGDWSYAFYLLHATIIYFVLDLVGKRPASWSNLVWYLGLAIVSIGAAAALHFGIEKPFERRLRGWWDRRLIRRASEAPQVNA